MFKPKNPARVNWNEEHKIVVITDGRNTYANLFVRDDEQTSWQTVAQGHAKRRINEQRDDVLGSRLALARMFQEAADGFVNELAVHHNVSVDGHDLGVLPDRLDDGEFPPWLEAFRDAGLDF